MKYLLPIMLVLLVVFTGCISVIWGTDATGVPQAAEGKPSIVYFTVAPDYIQRGGQTTVSWKVTGATSVIIVPEIGSAGLETAVMVYPRASTVYTLTASNAAGAVTQTASIIVAGDLPGQSPSDRTAELSILSSESGSLIKNMSDYTTDGAVCAGDNAANLASRAFLSFDISSLPQGASVSEAVLDLNGYALAGNPTYATANWGNMGALEVYQYQYGSSASLGRLAYDAVVPVTGSLRLAELTGDPLEVDVTKDGSGNDVIQRLLADGQSRSQFRVQFFTSTNWNGKADMICMDRAVLRIRYRVP
jgi:hypothetical protein